jgi:transcriptional regulator with XRE-family HTH domain
MIEVSPEAGGEDGWFIMEKCHFGCESDHLSSRLTHSLRTYRKRSGLSQREVSFLLGAKHKAKISRYENGHRLPPLRTALAYATIFDVPLSKLFPNIQRNVEKEIVGRILELEAKLTEAPKRKRGSSRARRTLEWVSQRHAGITNAN